ncbi:MAG: phosphatidylinositol phosphate synthase [Beutenbergiaceae bacterium]
MTSTLFTPIATLLVRMRIPPNAVTVAGTIAVTIASLSLFPMGHLTAGSLIVGVLVLSDSIDGLMARQIHGQSPRPYGEFLDSTLDRFSDGAIFGGLTVYLTLHTSGPMQVASVSAGLACVVLGGLVPYARAKAQALNVVAKVGIAERADRLIAGLVAALLVGLGAPELVLIVALGLLALASVITVFQRIVVVRRTLAKA